jgi:hypothetical protein
VLYFGHALANSSNAAALPPDVRKGFAGFALPTRPNEIWGRARKLGAQPRNDGGQLPLGRSRHHTSGDKAATEGFHTLLGLGAGPYFDSIGSGA